MLVLFSMLNTIPSGTAVTFPEMYNIVKKKKRSRTLKSAS